MTEGDHRSITITYHCSKNGVKPQTPVIQQTLNLGDKHVFHQQASIYKNFTDGGFAQFSLVFNLKDMDSIATYNWRLTSFFLGCYFPFYLIF